MIVSTAALCLALNVYHEARGEMIPGQYAVALVTINRVKKSGRSVCAEVFRAKQFSWANVGVERTAQGWRIPLQLVPNEAYAWWVAQRVAKMTLEGRMADITLGATHYHAKKVRPVWTASLLPVKTIDSHHFYRLH